MELNNILFSIFLLSFGYLSSKYFLLVLKKNKSNLLADNQFKKPQAFHEYLTYRLGGIIIFSSLILIFLYLYFFKNIFLLEYISFCGLFFFLGLADDAKINIAPKFRLFIMIFLLIFLIIYNKFSFEKISLEYLDHLMKIDIFALFFVCLCFLFIINGSNLIDGFNGLLGIHTLIIISILFYINLMNENYNLTHILFFTGLAVLIFIKYNFPKAQMFLGDSGAYLLGTFLSVSTIVTNNLTPSISSFFFCILLFYLFFEVFFSFFRKIFFVKQNPLLPDNQHLHMLIYKYLLKKNNKKAIANFKTSIYINLTYLILIIPGFIFMHNGLFCRYYFFSLLIIYFYFYKRFSRGV
tara:strand:- start:36 stop:1091 length:1056 start_codon:yes stop_codon:yes gene_type:complete